MSKPEKPEIDNSDISDPTIKSAPEISAHPKKCPLHTNLFQTVLNLLMAAFGSIGLYYLNLWLAISYLIFFVLFFHVIMPVKACQYCFFHIEGLTLDQWKEEYLALHEANWKKYGLGLFVIWLIPIIGISISFFIEFEIIALVALIAFLVVLIILQVNMRKNLCPDCEMLPYCSLHKKE
ncbi:MAG: hypothetical protein ACTSYA_05595 [Candidatus Kariarchaeaceae archaeon]